MKRLFGSLMIAFAICSPVIASDPAPADWPVFTLDWSEYPSWSTFGVADEIGMIDGEKGKVGEFEKKHKVDLVLHLRDYDTCITEYGSGAADFVCITNMDVLSPSLGRRSTAILPTSTSAGADALIVSKDITNIDQLKGKQVHGLAKSVSQYCFDRNVEIQGGNPDDYKFTNMDPGAASIAFQQKQSGVQAIVVWNPFVIETLNKRKDCHVLVSSQATPNEIVDMVAGANDSIKKPGGDRAAKCIIETFYAINGRLADATHKDDTLIALGEKFANLTLLHMRTVVRQTRFYDSPDKAIKLFEGQDHQQIMDRVAAYCVKREITPKQPDIAYRINGNLVNSKGQVMKDANLTFDTQYIRAVAPSTAPTK